MSNLPTTDDTRKIHDAYRALTGLDIPYCMSLHFQWEAWLAAGYAEPDLACAIRYIKRTISQGRGRKESLLLRNLIANRDNFAETLAIARAESRQQSERNQDAAKKSVLAATGRKMPEKEARPVVNIMEESAKLAAMLKQWRESQL